MIFRVNPPEESWFGSKKKTIPTSFATIATSGSYNDLQDKPSVFDGSYNSLINTPDLDLESEECSITGFGKVAISDNYDDLNNSFFLFDIGKFDWQLSNTTYV